MKSKAAGCGSISTVVSGIVLLCVSSIVIIIIITIIIIIIIARNDLDLRNIDAKYVTKTISRNTFVGSECVFNVAANQFV